MSNGSDCTERRQASRQVVKSYVLARWLELQLSTSPMFWGRHGLSREADTPMFIAPARPQQPSQQSIHPPIPTFAASASTSNTPMRATT